MARPPPPQPLERKKVTVNSITIFFGRNPVKFTTVCESIRAPEDAELKRTRDRDDRCGHTCDRHRRQHQHTKSSLRPSAKCKVRLQFFFVWFEQHLSNAHQVLDHTVTDHKEAIKRLSNIEKSNKGPFFQI